MGQTALPVTISPEYRLLNRRLMRDNPGYGLGGAGESVIVGHFAEALKARTLIDYGCGQGALRAALAGLPWWRRMRGKVYEYDPCIKGKDKVPAPADLVVSTDVLEHVEPEYWPAVRSELRRLGQLGCYVSIACRPSNKWLKDGRNTHLIVKAPEWWIGQFMDEGWTILSAQIGYRKYSPEPRGVRIWMAA